RADLPRVRRVRRRSPPVGGARPRLAVARRRARVGRRLGRARGRVRPADRATRGRRPRRPARARAVPLRAVASVLRPAPLARPRGSRMSDDRKGLLDGLGDLDWDDALDEWEKKAFLPELARDADTNQAATPLGKGA